MADQNQSSGMCTRAQGRAQPRVEQDGAGSGGTESSNASERSSSQESQISVVDIAADVQTEDEPVLTVSDRRIRALVAQTNMEKMRLDTAVKDLDIQATRHQEYQANGEEALFLVERAKDLKQKMKKAKQMEESLVAKLCTLTGLLEMLNLEGNEEQRKKGVELSNRVAAEIEKYSGKVETFQHNNKATLMFALDKTGGNSSQSSSRNSSVERRYSRIHDHLKPQPISWDDSLETVSQFKEKFTTWIQEVTRCTGPDKPFVWNSLLSLLDAEWCRRLRETKGLKEKELKDIFNRIDDILQDRFPLIVRRMDYERLTKGKNELPSAFIERVFTASNQAQLDHAPLVARVLVKIITSLGTDNLNKTVKDYLIKLMRENPNIDKKDDILTYIYAVESDETAKLAAEKKDRVSRVDEDTIQCKVCDKKHKKKAVWIPLPALWIHWVPQGEQMLESLP